MKIHGLGQVKIEASFLATLNVIRRSKSGQRHGFNWLFSLGLGNQIIAAAVRQRDIGQDDVKIF